MTYKKFMEQVKEQILSYLPEEYANANISLQEKRRNIDQKSYALRIERPEDRIVPSIQMEGLYQMHQNGWEMNKILDTVAQMYLDSAQKQSFRVSNYDSIKDNLYVAVLNKANNQEYLKDIVHKDIPGTDITAVLRVLCARDQENGIASFMVNKSMLEMWGIAGKDIYDLALENTKRLFPPKMVRLEDMIYGGNALQSKVLQPCDQYALTNDAVTHGAAVMLYQNVLQQIGEATKSSFIILPSSIHELILMKDTGEWSIEELQRMVIEINRTRVRPDQVLSDEIYSYDYREQKLTMLTDPAQTKEYVEQMAEEYGYGDFEEEDDAWEMER